MMKNALKTTLGAIALVAMTTLPAVSATVTVLASSDQGATNTAGTGFAQGYGAINIGTWSADPTFDPTIANPDAGNAPGQSQSPFNSNGLTNTQSYFTVGGTADQGGAPSPVTLTFGTTQTAFSILWGSIDSYNTLSFFKTGEDGPFKSYTGTDIITAGNLGGTGPNFEKVALVSFSGLQFDSVKFESSSAAFEFALIPLPAGGLLLLTALGGIAALRRRKAA